jgi:hypothetical protein
MVQGMDIRGKIAVVDGDMIDDIPLKIGNRFFNPHIILGTQVGQVAAEKGDSFTVFRFMGMILRITGTDEKLFFLKDVELYKVDQHRNALAEKITGKFILLMAIYVQIIAQGEQLLVLFIKGFDANRIAFIPLDNTAFHGLLLVLCRFAHKLVLRIMPNPPPVSYSFLKFSVFL